MKLLIKYCGGCNPSINRTKLVNEVVNLLKIHTSVEIVKDNADVGLMVGGCAAACVDSLEIRKMANQWVVAAGELLDGFAVKESDLAQATVQKIIEISAPRR